MIERLYIRYAAAALLAMCCAATSGCAMLAPSNQRNWSPDQAVLPYVLDLGPEVCIRNVRNCNYRATNDYDVRYYDKRINLERVESVDFIVCPFPGVPMLAHTMLSFGLGGGEYLAVSVEIRKERGEQFAVWKGGMRQYEIMYVVGDERDLICLRTNFRGDDVYVYRTRATPREAQMLFLDVLERVNELNREPEFYNTFSNNCTTNIVRHVNRLTPNRVPPAWEIVLPGYADRYAYDLGLLKTTLPLEEARQQAKVNAVAREYGDGPDFSERIRR